MCSCLLVLLVNSYEDEKCFLVVLILRALWSCWIKTAIRPKAMYLALKSGMTHTVDCDVALQYYQLAPTIITKIVEENQFHKNKFCCTNYIFIQNRVFLKCNNVFAELKIIVMEIFYTKSCREHRHSFMHTSVFNISTSFRQFFENF